MSIEFAVASSQNQNRCVGYWGTGDPVILAQQLALVAEANWCRATGTNEISIALSAPGLPPNDVWIRASDQCLKLGRDEFGRMTLYWLQLDRVIWFASRLQLLLPLVSAPRVSIPALYGYSCFSYIPTPLTPVAGIMSVAAGTEQVWQVDDARNFSLATSQNITDWRESDTQLNNERMAIAQLQSLLMEAIERQITDLQGETVGVLLSGGLDSSIVAALLVRAGVKVRGYTLDFGDVGIPEYPYAEQVAAYLQIPLVKVAAHHRQIDRAIVATIKSLDLPFGDGVTVPLYLLIQAASQDVKIIFNGEGGDQLFAGWTNKPLIAASVYRSVDPAGAESFSDCYLRTCHRLWGYEAQVFSPEVYDQIRGLHAQDWLETALDATTTHTLMHRLRRASLMLKGAQNILPRATNIAAASGLQVRSPFGDRALTAWTFQIASTLYLQGACEKYILKQAVADWLPPEIVWRTKRGMGVPLTDWCLNHWWRSLGRWLHPDLLKAEGIWRSDLAMRVAMGDVGSGIQGRRIGEILWLLISWELWQEHVLGRNDGRRSSDRQFWLPYRMWRRLKNFG